MSEEQDPKAVQRNPSSSVPPSTTPTKVAGEISSNGGNSSNAGWEQKIRYPNRPDITNPDPATLRDQWRFAIRQYSKWYSHAWGTAILAGISFFALGWIVKGSNPLPSKKDEHPPPSPSSADNR
ncbi:uncharacterized protein LOC122640520 [Telopea speciosissima]|uniref:uncharacterized protein LOC122640520 n=1 Tax=Telopea speciosissima TaxID=54955 RepID=UPI001CC69FC7|nr:uncharacterized protein LOC122640520 [Telopea speciosissima]